MELKAELQNLGHTFVSKTDTEVMPHLIEETLKQNPKPHLSTSRVRKPQTNRRLLRIRHNLHT